MGIFNFFKKPQKVEEIIREMNLSELGIFVSSLSKKTIEDANLSLVEIKEEIDLEKEKVVENIQKLDDAKIKNQDLPERVKQIAEGNRDICIQKINVFMKGINPPSNFDDCGGFCESFDKNFELFDKGTVKSYQILPKFFPDEILGISLPIKNLNDLSRKIRKLTEDTEVEKYTYLKKKIGEIEEKIVEEEKLNGEIGIIKEVVQTKIEKLAEKEVKIREIELGNEYEKFLELTDKKKVLESKIKVVEKKQSDHFFGIEPALKKYERLVLDYTLIRKYLANPLKALLDDKELKIVEIVKKMRESILEEKLELKEQKKKRILKELEGFTREDFEMFFDEHTKLGDELREVSLKLDGIKVFEELEKVKEEFRVEKESLEENKSKVSSMEEELRVIDIGSLKRALEVDLKEMIGESVRIIEKV